MSMQGSDCPSFSKKRPLHPLLIERLAFCIRRKATPLANEDVQRMKHHGQGSWRERRKALERQGAYQGWYRPETRTLHRALLEGILDGLRSSRQVVLRLSNLSCLCTASVMWIIPPSSCVPSCCISCIVDQWCVDQRTVCTRIIGIDRGMRRVGILERFWLILCGKHLSASASDSGMAHEGERRR